MSDEEPEPPLDGPMVGDDGVGEAKAAATTLGGGHRPVEGAGGHSPALTQLPEAKNGEPRANHTRDTTDASPKRPQPTPQQQWADECVFKGFCG